MDSPNESIDHAAVWEETDVVIEEFLFENMDNDTVEDVPPPAQDPKEDDPLKQLAEELEREPPSQVTELLRGLTTLSREIEAASQRQQADAEEQRRRESRMQSAQANDIRNLTQQILSCSVYRTQRIL